MADATEIHAKIFRDYEINPGWMKQTYLDIRSGVITLKDAAKSVPIRSILGDSFYIEIHWKTLSKKFRENGMTVFASGRKNFRPELDEHVIQQIQAIYEEIRCGITKIWERANKEGMKISRKKVEKICKSCLGFPSKVTRPKNSIRCRYLISQVNGVWHGDIHYITLNHTGELKYLFALIDDRSRFIVGWGLFDHKTTEAVIQTFQSAIQNTGETPLAYWSDNGGENTSLLARHFFDVHHIHHITTMPGNPQQNGKIERWWQKLDQFLSGAITWDQVFTIINYYVSVYNYSIPHHGLEKRNGFHCYPFEVYSDRRLQKTNIFQCQIMIDGTAHPLWRFIRRQRQPPNIYDIYSLLN